MRSQTLTDGHPSPCLLALGTGMLPIREPTGQPSTTRVDDLAFHGVGVGEEWGESTIFF